MLRVAWRVRRLIRSASRSSARPLTSTGAGFAAAPSLNSVHTISLFVHDRPGVLVRVAIVFARRGYNIESLVVSPAAREGFSRMTITCSGDPDTLEQIIKQLAKLVDGLAIEGENDVADLDPRGRGRSARIDTGDQGAARLAERQALGNLLTHRLDVHAEPSSVHMALSAKLLDHRHREARRNGESDPHAPAAR